MARIGEASWKGTLAAAALASGLGMGDSPAKEPRQSLREFDRMEQAPPMTNERARSLASTTELLRSRWGDLSREEIRTGMEALMDELDRVQEEKNPNFAHDNSVLTTDLVEDFAACLDDLRYDDLSLDTDSMTELVQAHNRALSMNVKARNEVIDALYQASQNGRLSPALATRMMEHFEDTWQDMRRLHLVEGASPLSDGVTWVSLRER